MNKKNIISILILILAVLVGGFWFMENQKVDKKKNIANQEISEKSIDINQYAEKLPPVSYNKIDYPVKEVYAYKFNGYSITIDIPEGFEVFTVKKPRRVKPIKSTSISDSCEKHDGICSGPSTGYWVNPTVESDDWLCIMNSDVRDQLEDKKACKGIAIFPKISKYTGISISDILENTVDRNFNSKKVNDNMVFFVSDSRGSFFSQTVISDKQLISADAPEEWEWDAVKISRDLYFSILDSIKLKD